jgi:hypothetical protein
MTLAINPCPSCGSTATRRITRKELRERNAGRDPVVVVMPLICPACGHTWQPPLSRGTYYLVAGLTGVLAIIGFVVSATCVVLLVHLTMVRDAGEPFKHFRYLAVLLVVAFMAFLTAIGAAMTCRKYLGLARKR